MPLPTPAPVLIVDDDELIRGILRSRLERAGVSVVTAASAEEALGLIEVMRIGVLVLDLHMPGQSGLDLAEFVRLFGAHLTGVPILIFTGTTLTAETHDLASRHNAEVFLKPDGLPALLERTAELADPVNQLLRAERPDGRRSPAGSRDTSNDYKEPES
jgi:two-component system cell cycle response regulator DivK